MIFLISIKTSLLRRGGRVERFLNKKKEDPKEIEYKICLLAESLVRRAIKIKVKLRHHLNDPLYLKQKTLEVGKSLYERLPSDLHRFTSLDTRISNIFSYKYFGRHKLLTELEEAFFLKNFPTKYCRKNHRYPGALLPFIIVTNEMLGGRIVICPGLVEEGFRLCCYFTHEIVGFEPQGEYHGTVLFEQVFKEMINNDAAEKNEDLELKSETDDEAIPEVKKENNEDQESYNKELESNNEESEQIDGNEEEVVSETKEVEVSNEGLDQADEKEEVGSERKEVETATERKNEGTREQRPAQEFIQPPAEQKNREQGLTKESAQNKSSFIKKMAVVVVVFASFCFFFIQIFRNQT